MHTDEYEISIGREVNHCQAVVDKTRDALDARSRRFGVTYAEAAQAAADGRPVVASEELAAWQEDIEALPRWEQRLEEYRQALAAMRISAAR